jgi:hypothetical protein
MHASLAGYLHPNSIRHFKINCEVVSDADINININPIKIFRALNIMSAADSTSYT